LYISIADVIFSELFYLVISKSVALLLILVSVLCPFPLFTTN